MGVKPGLRSNYGECTQHCLYLSKELNQCLMNYIWSVPWPDKQVSLLGTL
jgi:hypothetical protein